MINIPKTLGYIYKNRWRESVYEDSSRGWILLILYISTLVIFYQKESKYVTCFLLFIMILQTMRLHVDRKDYNLLFRFYRKAQLSPLLFTDYMLFNLPVLLVILSKNGLYFVLSVVFIFLVSLTKLSFHNKWTYLPLSNKDPLWKSYLRKYPFVILLFIASYYVHVESILNENPNLSLGGYFAIPLAGLFINSERDKIIFIKQSKIPEKEFLVNIIKANVFNTLLFLIPHIIIDLCQLNFEFSGIFLITILTIMLTCLRYIFFLNTLTFSLISILLIVGAFSLSFYEGKDQILIAGIALLLTIFTFRLAKNTIKKLKISNIY
ncbi:MAG: hypothetical protein LBQ84_01365 [Flavobacteriaceae bacterium]|jgi:hypothetical protein|nr:hypothetical protein [Flavobacteriaceae bacterium]